MSKSLKTIQVIVRIGRILSLIVFVASIIGIAGAIVGILTLALGVGDITIGDLTLKSIIENEAGLSMGTLYTTLACSALLCAGEGVIAKFAEIYFKREEAAGTPFTFEGAKELFRLGIISIAVSFGAFLLACICQGIMVVIFKDAVSTDFSSSTSIGLGVAMMIVSVILKCATENIADKDRALEEYENGSDTSDK